MLTTNNRTLHNTPFICASYPDVAKSILLALDSAGKYGLDRWALGKACSGIPTYKVTATISQLEVRGIVITVGRFCMLGGYDISDYVVDRFNSTQARILRELCVRGGETRSCSEISKEHFVSRSQIQPAARDLEKMGYITITTNKPEGRNPRVLYTMNDIKPLTIFPDNSQKND